MLPATVSAQTYPPRNVTFVVGYAPGGTGDVVARLIAQKLSGALGKSVSVENLGPGERRHRGAERGPSRTGRT